MNKVINIAAIVAIASATAMADLIEMQAGGVIASQINARMNPDTGPDRQGASWDLSIVFDSDHLWGPTRSSSLIRSAVFRVGDQTYTADILNQPEYAGGHFWNSRDDMHDMWSDGAVFTLDFGEGVVLDLSMFARPDWWLHPVTDSADGWAGQSYAEFFPTEFDLLDFEQLNFQTGFNGMSDGTDWLITTLLSGGDPFPNYQWHMDVTSLTGRAVPTPAGLIALGGMGLLAARRRR